MNYEITISGFGGQGVLFIGRILMETSFDEGKNVSWLPNYGAEKRGGVCSCYVNISDERIGSIFITHPDIGIAMNPAAYDMLNPAVKSGGLMFVNQSLIKLKSERLDVRYVYVPCIELAQDLGDESVGNLIALGAVLANTQIVTATSVIKVLNRMVTRNIKQLDMNKAALLRGCEIFY